MTSLVEQRFVEQILRSEGERLLKSQEMAFARKLKFRTGRIASQRNAQVSTSGEYSGKLTISHTAYQRFLDLKVVKRGGSLLRSNRKIHNRYIWGHFSSISYRLANDFTESVKARLKSEIEK